MRRHRQRIPAYPAGTRDNKTGARSPLKRIIVTGAGGYVGIPLCRMLVQRGYHVVAVDRYFFGKDKLGDLASNTSVDVVVQDTRQFDPALFKGADGVIDLAGLSND